MSFEDLDVIFRGLISKGSAVVMGGGVSAAIRRLERLAATEPWRVLHFLATRIDEIRAAEPCYLSDIMVVAAEKESIGGFHVCAAIWVVLEAFLGSSNTKELLMALGALNAVAKWSSDATGAALVQQCAFAPDVVLGGGISLTLHARRATGSNSLGKWIDCCQVLIADRSDIDRYAYKMMLEQLR